MLEAVFGSQMMLAYSKMGRSSVGYARYLVLSGLCKCFCGGRLKLCLLSVQSC